VPVPSPAAGNEAKRNEESSIPQDKEVTPKPEEPVTQTPVQETPEEPSTPVTANESEAIPETSPLTKGGAEGGGI